MNRLLAALVIVLNLAIGACALDIPKLESRVTDRAGLLTPEQIAALEGKLQDLETSDSTQIAILIIPGLEGESLEDYSERVASSWRLGQKGRDNGALMLIAMKERKVRIEVGYGLEATLTDARSRSIIQNEIVPYFREGNYYQGIDAAATALIQTVRGTYQPVEKNLRPASSRSGRHSFDFLIFLLVPLLWVLSSTGKWGGGLLGAGAGMYLSHSLAGMMIAPLLIGGVVGAVAGAIVGALVRAAGKSQGTHRGGFGGPFFWGGGGGGGGFSGGGGGFSGGGFSGGGGSFGGGGSSGSW